MAQPPTSGTNPAQYIELGVNILLIPLLTYGRRWVRQEIVDPINTHKKELELHMANNKKEFKKQDKINRKIVQQLNILNAQLPPPTPHSHFYEGS